MIQNNFYISVFLKKRLSLFNSVNNVKVSFVYFSTVSSEAIIEQEQKPVIKESKNIYAVWDKNLIDTVLPLYFQGDEEDILFDATRRFKPSHALFKSIKVELKAMSVYIADYLFFRAYYDTLVKSVQLESNAHLQNINLERLKAIFEHLYEVWKILLFLGWDLDEYFEHDIKTITKSFVYKNIQLIYDESSLTFKFNCVDKFYTRKADDYKFIVGYKSDALILSIMSDFHKYSNFFTKDEFFFKSNFEKSNNIRLVVWQKFQSLYKNDYSLVLEFLRANFKELPVNYYANEIKRLFRDWDQISVWKKFPFYEKKLDEIESSYRLVFKNYLLRRGFDGKKTPVKDKALEKLTKKKINEYLKKSGKLTK